MQIRPFEWFLVGTKNGRIVAAVMAGYDGHCGNASRNCSRSAAVPR